MFIEVQAIGLELKDLHAKQAVDYAANQGVEWVALTNGHLWKVFRVIFAKLIDNELVLDIDVLALGPKNAGDLELDELREALEQEVIKREAIEGDKADGARKKVVKAAGKMLRIRKGKDGADDAPGEAAVVVPVSPERRREELA